MTIAELVELIAAADARQGGCSVEITVGTDPAHQRGTLYAIVAYGMQRAERGIHTEGGLRDFLGGLA